ncbi:DNA-directed RNA polymerase I subunit RPA43-like [Crassostrea virginica]
MNFSVISFKEAEEIMKSTEHSQFVRINKHKRIIFHPRFLGNTRKGVEEALKSERNLVSEEFGGALIAYNNIQVQQAMGLIVDPYIHFDIVADFIVFKPTVGSILTGVVHRVFKSHVSLLVYGIFNASIKKSKSNEDQLREGSEVEFKVERIYVNNRILSMHGALLSDDVPKGQRKTQRNSHIKSFDEDQVADEEPKTAEESMEFESNPQEDTGVLNASSFNGIDETYEDVKLAFEDSPPTKNKKSEKKKKKKSKKEKI